LILEGYFPIYKQTQEKNQKNSKKTMKKYYLCVEWYNGSSSLYEVPAPKNKNPHEIVNWLAGYLEKTSGFNEDRDSIILLGGEEDITRVIMDEEEINEETEEE
jgi:hypothetical protein